MQAISKSVTAFASQYQPRFELQLRAKLRFSTGLFVGLLFATIAVPEATNYIQGEYRLAADYARRDLSRSEIAVLLEDRLPEQHKRDAKRLASLVHRLAERHKFSPSLILSVIETESSYRYDVVSHAGAIGLMQLLPATAGDIAKRYRIYTYTKAADLTRPEVNLALGVAYLAHLRRRFGEPAHYLSAYNMGPGGFRKRLEAGNFDENGEVAAQGRNIETRTKEVRNSRGLPSGQVLLPDRFARIGSLNV